MHETALFSHNYGLKSDATIVFLDPDFLNNAEISAIRTYIRVILHIFHLHEQNGRISTSGLKSGVTIAFLDPDFLKRENFGDSRTFKADIGT